MGAMPKRSEERIRRNKDVVPVEKVNVVGSVEVPELGLEDPHSMIVDFYESLAESGQARYYEPSDWQFARFTMHFADKLIKSGKPSSQMLASINTMLTALLVSEGDRRRVRMEVERQEATQEIANNVSDLFRERLKQ